MFDKRGGKTIQAAMGPLIMERCMAVLIKQKESPASSSISLMRCKQFFSICTRKEVYNMHRAASNAT